MNLKYPILRGVMSYCHCYELPSLSISFSSLDPFHLQSKEDYYKLMRVQVENLMKTVQTMFRKLA